MTENTSNSNPKSEAKLTRGHKKKARTRQQLVDAALRIYANKGVAELTLNELAIEAGVASGTIYNYFRTKEEVLNAVGISLAEALSLQITSLTDGIIDGAERFSIGVRTFVLMAEQDPDWASALLNVFRYAEMVRSTLADNIREDLRRGQDQGQFKYDDEEVAVNLVVSAVMGVFRSIVERRKHQGQDQVITKMLLQALGMNGDDAEVLVGRPVPALG
ncbi:TetR/AcrR family transcriptional regulator [Gallaecimonas kandeliae]|uniref:TetR/AcrR family transcriptional regulator n=1 Tax=Gallaecimonas kandeliae TaxID=3029055 RepID=UPI00264A4709|nr:TetR/AcrR family transcriptional regulator [Gallaecimonas kandeliae]WKE67346.1 TetR/AcrR family transcriptional regulator [Gallaecimonas kandeliae]